MKWVAALLLAAATAACSQPLDARAPVTVATRLYTDCMASKATTSDIEPTRVGIVTFVEEADAWCMQWTAIWFRPLTGQGLEDRRDNLERFIANTLRFKQALLTELRKQALR